MQPCNSHNTHTHTHTLVTGGAQGYKRQRERTGGGERRRMLEGSRKETMEHRGAEPRAKTREGARIKDGCVCLLVLFWRGGVWEVGVWSQPKGPPPQGRHTIKHSEMKCVIAGGGSGFRDRSGRAGPGRWAEPALQSCDQYHCIRETWELRRRTSFQLHRWTVNLGKVMHRYYITHTHAHTHTCTHTDTHTHVCIYVCC